MQIDIDFEVFKALTMMRRDERDSLNNVLRRLIKLDGAESEMPVRPAPSNGSSGCVFKGVLFPENTQFRASYKGKTYLGAVTNGTWTDEAGGTYSSPSQAAFAIQQSGVNGWTFWECKRPEDAEWVRLCTLRSGYAPLTEVMAAVSATKQ